MHLESGSIQQQQQQQIHPGLQGDHSTALLSLSSPSLSPHRDRHGWRSSWGEIRVILYISTLRVLRAMCFWWIWRRRWSSAEFTGSIVREGRGELRYVCISTVCALFMTRFVCRCQAACFESLRSSIHIDPFIYLDKLILAILYIRTMKNTIISVETTTFSAEQTISVSYLTLFVFISRYINVTWQPRLRLTQIYRDIWD